MQQAFRQCLSLVALLCLSTLSSAVDVLVDVGAAQYKGAVVDSALQVSAWKGIQYGAPPVGQLRFAAPHDPTVKGLINATADRANCPPSRPDDWTVNRPANWTRFHIAEDCLYLNVHAPTQARNDSKLPVVVFFQGGGKRNLLLDQYRLLAELFQVLRPCQALVGTLQRW